LKNKNLVNTLFSILQDTEMGVGEIQHRLKENGHALRGRSFTRQQIAGILAKNKLFVKTRKQAKTTLWKANPDYKYIERKRKNGGEVPSNWERV
tara:strand:+ start:9259 stop:9540 length:282 start_codon:yes stop_codon:yes gene_type:complete